MTIKNLLKAEITMLWGELKQYGLNTLFYNLGMLVVFVGLFMTVKDSKSGMDILFGLVMWQISSGAIGYLGYVIEDEAMLGTLEQIFMTRTSIFKVFFSKAAVNCIFGIVKAYLLFFICVLVFGVQGEIVALGFERNLYIFFIILAVEISFYMVGLMFGGMALFFKRVSNVVQLLTYVMLFFTNITTPVSETPQWVQVISTFVPIRWAMEIIRSITAGSPVVMEDTLYFATSIGCYCVIGVITFLFSVNIAKEKGKLAGY